MSQAVNHVDTTDQATCNVAIREGRHVINDVCVVATTLILDLLNDFMVWLLTSSLDIEGATVLCGPLTPLEPLIAQDKE